MKLALTATPSQARFAPILLRGQMDEALAVAAELGYDGIELHLRVPDDIERVAVNRLAEHHGLGFAMLGTGMAASEDRLTFSDTDFHIRHQAVERVLAHIDLAAYLGGAPVAIGLIRGSVGKDAEQCAVRWEYVQECLLYCCRRAEIQGVDLLLEPINRYETDCGNTVAEVLYFIERVNSPCLKLLADTFHMNIEEVDICASLRLAGSRLGHVHLVDSNRQVVGHGHLDVHAVLQTLRDMGYGGYLSFEALPLPDPRQAAEDAIRYVRALLAER